MRAKPAKWNITPIKAIGDFDTLLALLEVTINRTSSIGLNQLEKSPNAKSEIKKLAVIRTN